jgi:hypothetical protein
MSIYLWAGEQNAPHDEFKKKNQVYDVESDTQRKRKKLADKKRWSSEMESAAEGSGETAGAGQRGVSRSKGGDSGGVLRPVSVLETELVRLLGGTGKRCI